MKRKEIVELAEQKRIPKRQFGGRGDTLLVAMSDKNQPRILIVGTQPYNPMVQSRAFDSYFHLHDSDRLVQVFSDSRTPCKGHCGRLYQITDRRLLDARMKKTDPGIPLLKEDLPEQWTEEGAKSGFAPRRKTSLTMLLRKLVWNRKYYLTPQFDAWLNEFKPQVVFLSFSRDFFIFDIAFYVANKYSIPIIASSADDYVFDQGFSLSPFTWIYRSKFNRYIHKLISMDFAFMFESEKIRARYEVEFHARSFIQYICTGNPVADKPDIPDKIRTIGYFGNLEAGRLQSILDVAETLCLVSPETKLLVYTKDLNEVTKRIKEKHPNVSFYDQVPYGDVLRISKGMDALLIVESLKKEHVRTVRYSLSTKVADSLSFGKPIIAYGGEDTGAMDFLKENGYDLVFTSKSELQNNLRDYLNDTSKFVPSIEVGLSMCRHFFNLNEQAERFEENVQTLFGPF